MQPAFPPFVWRSPASPKTCSGCWSVVCSSPMWLSMPGILGKNWDGRMRPCCVLSAHTSDSCFWGPRPGRRDIGSFTWRNLICYFTTWASSHQELHSSPANSSLVQLLKHFAVLNTPSLVGQGTSTVTVCLQRAGTGPTLAAVHLGRGHHWWHATIRGAPDRTTLPTGGEGPSSVYVPVGDAHVYLQR